MKIICPKCHAQYESQSDIIGNMVECQCGFHFIPEAEEEKKVCPMCREKVMAEAKICRFCGFYFDKNAKPKSTAIYILLALFLGQFGAHNFYAGEKSDGFVKICFVIASFVCAVIAIINFSTDSVICLGSFVFILIFALVVFLMIISDIFVFAKKNK